MKTKFIILVMVMATAFTTILQGQIGSALRNKASQAIGNIGRKAAKEAKEETDSLARQKAEEAVSKDIDESRGSREQKGINFGGLLGGKVDLKHEDSYDFHNYIYMQVDIYTEKEPLKMDYHMYFNNDNLNGGIESKMVANTDEGTAAISSAIIADGTNKCMIMLTEIGQTKFGMISAVPDEETEQQAGADKQSDLKSKEEIIKTGNTRVIAGYKCDEYLYKDLEDRTSGKIWVTKDLKFQADKRAMNKSGLKSFYGSSELEGGAVLAMESYDENNKLTMKSETKEIKTNINHTITLQGYPLRQVNLNQMGPRQGNK